MKRKDPLEIQFELYEETIKIDPFLSSIPIESRVNHHKTWRRVVEEPTNIDEFSYCLIALNNLRSQGIHTPPYSALVETYKDGYKQYTLQVGHVEGSTFDNLEITEKIFDDYRELGHKILKYFNYCHLSGKAYLTDIARVDQYIYGQTNGITKPQPILVDLELHTSSRVDYSQLNMFEERFITPLEDYSNHRQKDLRNKLSSLALIS